MQVKYAVETGFCSPHLCVGFLFLVVHSRLPPPPAASLTPNLSTHNLLTHSLLTHNLLTHTQLVHTQLTHTQLVHTQLTHRQLFHTQLTHTQLVHTHLASSHTTYSHTRNLLTHTTYSHTTCSHTTDPPPSLFSFLPFPSHLHLSLAVYWKKLTCGVIRSFNFSMKKNAKISTQQIQTNKGLRY